MTELDKQGDLRTRRTRLALHKALLELIEEKSFADISVQDIADRAVINRVTFYKHYHDKYDLLEQTMQSMLAELAEPLETLLEQPGDQRVYEALVLWLEQVSQHTSLYRVILGKQRNAAFDKQLRQYLETMVEQISAHFPARNPGLGRAITIRFIAAGFLGVTEWWLEEGKSLSTHEAAMQFQHLLVNILYPTADK